MVLEDVQNALKPSLSKITLLEFVVMQCEAGREPAEFIINQRDIVLKVFFKCKILMLQSF
jgi:hypothetical protein